VQPGVDADMLAEEVAKQRQLTFARDRALGDRLQNVAWPLLLASTDLCPGNTAPGLGFEYANSESFAEDYRQAANSLYGIDHRLRVIHVTAGGPAESAGMKVGDVLLRVNGTQLPTGNGASRQSARIIAEALAKRRALSLAVRRDEQQLVLPLATPEICRFHVSLDPGDEINAYADGDNIYVTRGMLRYTKDDLQLSAAIAHELAHNAREHAKSKKKNYWMGAVADIAIWGTTGHDNRGQMSKIGANAYSSAFEAEADYIGVYAMALAGLDISSVADFWREIAAEDSSASRAAYASTHPSSAARVLAIENTVSEIEAQRSQGLALRPGINPD